MRVLLGIIALVLLLAIVGWITFSVSDERSSVNIETDKIEQDTERIVEGGKRLIDEADESLDESVRTESEAPPEEVDVAEENERTPAATTEEVEEAERTGP